MTDFVPEELLSMPEQRTGSWRDAETPARVDLVDALFRRHYTAVLRLAVVMLGSREAAEDAVQDAFVALHRHQRKLRDPDAAEAYLRSCVLNRCRSFVRRQISQRAPKPLMIVRAHHESPEETAVSRHEVDSLVTGMRTLARRQREVLACRYVLELSVAETAQLLSISEGAVKSHAHRGLRALQQRIEVTA
jgi:RNA polymerase sigma factor (sigma-70 family)